MTTHAAAPSFSLRHPQPTPNEALAAFIVAGKRDTLIAELTRKWYTLGQSEVEDAVDHAIAEAARAMHATREQAIYEYLRTAAHRVLLRRKERAGRVSAPLATDLDFDRLLGNSLTPEDVLLAKEHRSVVLDLVSELDDRTLAVMRLKHVEGLERKEVAARLGLSEKAVKKAIEKGLRACRERYDTAVEGALCVDRKQAIEAFERGEADARQARQARQHLDHCASCGARHRAVTATQRAAAAFVPLPLLATHSGLIGGVVRAAKRLLTDRLGGDAGATGVMAAGGTKLALLAVSLVAAGGAVHASASGHGGHGLARAPHIPVAASHVVVDASSVDTLRPRDASHTTRASRRHVHRPRYHEPVTSMVKPSAFATTLPPTKAPTSTPAPPRVEEPAPSAPSAQTHAARPAPQAPGEFPLP